MVDDQQLGFICNVLGAAVFGLVVIYHYISSSPSYAAASPSSPCAGGLGGRAGSGCDAARGGGKRWAGSCGSFHRIPGRHIFPDALPGPPRGPLQP